MTTINPRSDLTKLKIRVETVKRYYVLVDGDWQSIYGGPFDTKDEARDCIKEAKEKFNL